MPFYLHQWRYKDPEVKAMFVRPQNRADVVRLATTAFGGTLHSFFFCFGEFDGVCVSEFPDNETAMACLMVIVGQGGVAEIRTTPLLDQAEMRRAMEKAGEAAKPAAAGAATYTPPSQTG